MHIEIVKNKIKNGLYIVSTPIGNLEDITFRAIKVLNSSDYILCEDTRVSSKLNKKFNISSKLFSYHKFNEKKNINNIVNDLKNGKIISLVSDAGTPLISDPGKILLNECLKSEIKVIPVPGASAITTSVSISNFSDKFYFHGFIGNTTFEIEKDFKFLSNLEFTLVFFISSKKLNKIIPFLKKYFLKREIIICKELTKLYEEIFRLKIVDLNEFVKPLKGELTIIISNSNIKNVSKNLVESDKIIIKKLINKLSTKDIIKLLTKNSELSKSEIYKYCLELKNENKKI